MGLTTDVRVRQPANGDLVGRRFVVVGVGAGFEGTIGIRLLNPAGKVIGTGAAQSAGGGLGVGEFSTTLTVDRPPRAGTHAPWRSSATTRACPRRGRAPASTLGG